ncbi:MAG: hypothetical protein Q9174_003155 [Haloplaca sp. 1 TL-2023]
MVDERFNGRERHNIKSSHNPAAWEVPNYGSGGYLLSVQRDSTLATDVGSENRNKTASILAMISRASDADIQIDHPMISKVQAAGDVSIARNTGKTDDTEIMGKYMKGTTAVTREVLSTTDSLFCSAASFGYNVLGEEQKSKGDWLESGKPPGVIKYSFPASPGQERSGLILEAQMLTSSTNELASS